jgi:hypothetical protein
MRRYAIAALTASAIIIGVAVAWAQSFTMPPPGGVVVMGCAYNLVQPTLTDGQTGIVQCDSTGNIGGGGGGGGGGAITSPLGHVTPDTAGVSVVPTATATWSVTQSGGWSVTANAGTNLNTSALALDTSVGTTNTDLGAVGSSTCATDTGSCNLNAKLSRIAERLTAVINSTAATIADGADVTQGAVADAAYAGSGNATVVSALKGIYTIAASSSTVVPTTTGGLATYFVQPIAGDNHAVIKAGAGQVYKITVTNNSATINYLRLYDATTGFNGCNSATNIKYQALIPGNSTNGAGLVDSWDLGMAFATGISICVTSGYAQTDTTNATASAMSVTIGYK